MIKEILERYNDSILKEATEILERYNDSILKEATDRYGMAKDKVKALGSFESFVYEYELGKKRCILKITHSIRRSAEYIMGELDWLNYLADNGVSVSKALPSKHGNMVEVIKDEDKSYFLATAFKKAKGRFPNKKEWNSALFQRWGRTMGKMHALTKDYKLANSAFKRQEWHEEECLKTNKYIPSSQPIVIKKFRNLIKHLHSLPKDRDSYGLVHNDLHNWNFFINNEKITVFDFDDCEYNWFANDIAIALFYALRDDSTLKHDKPSFARYFMQNFLKGYNKENNIDTYWLAQIPTFLKLREMILYTTLYAEGADVLDPWSQRFMRNRKHKIENDVPIIDVEFD
jgi:Ser/Thr protein kinase RdoA (MazF antagonist)